MIKCLVLSIWFSLLLSAIRCILIMYPVLAMCSKENAQTLFQCAGIFNKNKNKRRKKKKNKTKKGRKVNAKQIPCDASVSIMCRLWTEIRTQECRMFVVCCVLWLIMLWLLYGCVDTSNTSHEVGNYGKPNKSICFGLPFVAHSAHIHTHTNIRAHTHAHMTWISPSNFVCTKTPKWFKSISMCLRRQLSLAKSE